MMQMVEPSSEFKQAVHQALAAAARYPDDAIQYMAVHVPVYVGVNATPDQAAAGGCVKCTYLGLWAASWPGYPYAPHGSIWLFERGIRSVGGTLSENTLAVMVHEFGHALQRDHVLEAMEQAKARGAWAPFRGCGSCPGA